MAEVRLRWESACREGYRSAVGGELRGASAVSARGAGRGRGDGGLGGVGEGDRAVGGGAAMVTVVLR